MERRGHRRDGRGNCVRTVINKILIANRGEIAVRIARACREMGIRTVGVYSDADRSAMHVGFMDEAYALGGNSPAESYLRQDRLLAIAGKSNVSAIHPGYGFLSENAAFAEAVESAGIVFIGPPPAAIRALGDKTSARKTAAALDIPTVPGTKEPVRSEQEALATAKSIGFPVLLKASAGGGGKGMRVVSSSEELAPSLERARSEAKNAFGDDRVYIEKYLSKPRHVEIQVLADARGNAVYLGERECSIQRRHQKLIEESPSCVVDERLRQQMGESALRLVKSVGYVNAGTVEYLVDERNNFYFLEVNTRLQVEHPVTEWVTGIDLVHQQIHIADGRPLSFQQSDIQKNGHAIECRVCAEDPTEDFLPSTGTLSRYVPPQGPRVRVDTGFREGDEVTFFYDPMMAKIIAWGEDRDSAIESMKRALMEFVVAGVKTTIPFSLQVLENESFRSGKYDTTFVTTHTGLRNPGKGSRNHEIAAAVAAVLLRGDNARTNGKPLNHNGTSTTWKTLRQDMIR